MIWTQTVTVPYCFAARFLRELMPLQRSFHERYDEHMFVKLKRIDAKVFRLSEDMEVKWEDYDCAEFLIEYFGVDEDGYEAWCDVVSRLTDDYFALMRLRQVKLDLSRWVPAWELWRAW